MSDQPVTPPAEPAPVPLRPPAPELGPTDVGPETALWTGRTHWTHFAGSVAVWLLASSVVSVACAWLHSRGAISGRAAFYAAAALIVGFGLVVGIRILIKVLGIRYRLTTQRLFIERGILSQTIDQTELVRVDDVRVRRSLADRILGLGTIDILSTDATDKSVVIDGVRDSQEIAEHVRERMRQLRRKSLYVEHL